jgi:hypothetical protein
MHTMNDKYTKLFQLKIVRSHLDGNYEFKFLYVISSKH